MANIIEIENLTKRYRGRGAVKAVDELNLVVQEGDIFGFVGPNGAGKTSTIRIMCTLLQATAGDIRVAGHSVHKEPRLVRQVIGYMPDFFGVYNDMMVWEYLDFFGACYNIPIQQRAGLINDLLELVELTHRRNDPVEGLSRGMKQRLSLARTLIHDPQVLILDEPASGLDPRARVEIRELLVQLARMGKTIFFSTHILADVAQICSRVGIIEGGKLVAAGGLEDLQKVVMPHRLVRVTVLDNTERVAAYLKTYPGVLEVRDTGRGNGNPSPTIPPEQSESITQEPPSVQSSNARGRLEFTFKGDDQQLSDLLKTLVSQGIALLHFSEETRDMEAVFMSATKGIVT
jgi:ABC-2 type transport system ATP-binding protein